MVKLIVGCGYLGTRVAWQWLAAGEPVAAVTRSPERAESLGQQGIRPIVADVTQPDTLAGLPASETVVYAVGYDSRGTASRREVYVDGLRALLDALPDQTRRIILISSTAVYGEAGGDWVEEDSACRPTREGGRAKLAAEQVLAEHPLSSRAIVLRLAGLYGPGRIPRMADLVPGQPFAVRERGYVNLIHVDDAAAVVLASEQRAQPPRTYCVSDGQPVGRRALYEYLAELLKLPPPEFVEPSPDASGASRADADKRVDNARMLAELEVELEYPSYREGLAAIVAAATS
jgi:nucleoside-diphosphate-sugar epimerase